LFIASAAALVLLLIGLSTIIWPTSQTREREPNDIFSSSTEISVGQSAVANISDAKDVDFYKIRVPDYFSG
jgi:hypothetical protein